MPTPSRLYGPGKSNGWSLIYCKGPEGEQLEFVQALGPVKKTFQEARDTLPARDFGDQGLTRCAQEKAISRCRKVPTRSSRRCAPKPAGEAELRAATLPLVALVRGDPENLVYFLQEDREAPGHFIFYEIFASQADFETHNAMPYVKAWFAKLPELAEGGVKAMRMEVLNGPGG